MGTIYDFVKDLYKHTVCTSSTYNKPITFERSIVVDMNLTNKCQLPCFVEQSMSCCTDSTTSFPVCLAWIPSREPVAVKAQHEPHAFCWNEERSVKARQEWPVSEYELLWVAREIFSMKRQNFSDTAGYRVLLNLTINVCKLHLHIN